MIICLERVIFIKVCNLASRETRVIESNLNPVRTGKKTPGGASRDTHGDHVTELRVDACSVQYPG